MDYSVINRLNSVKSLDSSEFPNLKKKCLVYHQDDFLFKIQLIKTKIIIEKYVRNLKKGYPTEFADSTKNYNKMVGIPNRKVSRKKYV
jgi:hypothetical protein